MADAVEAARARIDRALNDLEARIRALKAAPSRLPDDDLFASSHADSTRAAELEAAAREASEALEQAAKDVRSLLNGEG